MRSSPMAGVVKVAGRGVLAGREVVKVAVEAGGATTTATAIEARRAAKAALPPEPSNSRPRGRCALTAVVEVIPPATAR